MPEAHYFGRTTERDFLLISAIAGADASAGVWRGEPRRVIEESANGLRAVRGVAIDDCPFDARLWRRIEAARRNVELGLVDESDFDDERAGRSAASLFRELLETKPDDENLVFTHGDFCLPNVILNDWKTSGFVDWARGGVADEYQDIALLARSIAANFGAQHLPFLFDVLEIEADARKIRFYQLLDEFF